MSTENSNNAAEQTSAVAVVDAQAPVVEKQAAPALQSHAAWVASQQPIDTSKNAPKQVATPKQKAKHDAKAQSKPVALKKGADGSFGAIRYIVRGNGATKLFAHTQAWLQLTGLIDGKSYPASIVRELGGSALAYHTRKGNFEVSQGMAKLTAQGLNHFKARHDGSAGQTFAPEDVEHYILMMLSGVNDERLVKNQGCIMEIPQRMFDEAQAMIEANRASK